MRLPARWPPACMLVWPSQTMMTLLPMPRKALRTPALTLVRSRGEGRRWSGPDDAHHGEDGTQAVAGERVQLCWMSSLTARVTPAAGTRWAECGGALGRIHPGGDGDDSQGQKRGDDGDGRNDGMGTISGNSTLATARQMPTPMARPRAPLTIMSAADSAKNWLRMSAAVAPNDLRTPISRCAR